MNKVVKRGFSAYKVFLRNKLASSIMMLFAGVMMFIAGLNGRGNDTKSLPILITAVGAGLTLYAIYKVGYLKASYDRTNKSKKEEKSAHLKILLMQIAEALLYMVVLGLGVFLLVNESFTNKILDLIAGGFTTLNGVLGIIKIYKNRENKDFYWKLTIVLAALELILGPYFIFASNAISVTGYIIMGALTTVAGTIEVISAMTRDNLRCAVNDGKEIVQIIKDGETLEK